MFKIIKNCFATKKLKKSTSLYFSEKYDLIIITPRYINSNGLLIEQEESYISTFNIDENNLGEEIIKSLNKFSKTDKSDYKKTTDWPSFIKSKCKTVKEFEKEFINIDITSVNDSNLIIEISGTPYKNSLLTINSVISFFGEKKELGKRTFLIYEACKNRKFD